MLPPVGQASRGPRCIGASARDLGAPRARPSVSGRARRSVKTPVPALGSGGGGCGGPPGKHLGGNGDGNSGGGGRGVGRLPAALLLLCAASGAAAGPAHALRLRRRPPKPSSDVDRLVDLAWPILKNLGFSGCLGAVAGICFKTVGRSLAVVVGILFGIVQLGAALGYVSVDWARVHRDVLKQLDVNRDGRFDVTDLKSLVASVLAVLAQGVPSVGGFSAGFGLGLRL